MIYPALPPLPKYDVLRRDKIPDIFFFEHAYFRKYDERHS